MHVPAIVSLVSRLSQHFDVTVYSFVKPDGDDRSFSCGNAQVKFIRAHFDDSAPKKVFQFIKSFREDHKKQKFDLLHGFWGLPCGWIVVMLGKLFRLPSLVSLQGSESAYLPALHYGDMVSQPKRSLTLWTCENATALALLTRFQLQSLQRFGLKRTNSNIIPHGPEKNFYVERTAKAISSPVNFIHVGFANQVKDQEPLLKTFQRINEKIDSQLRIFGGGDLEDNLKNTVQLMGIADKVSFFGYLPHNQLPEQYKWADIMLHTSLYEGQGVAIAEAAASKVLIAGTDVGLISDMGNDATTSVAVGDYVSLADKVLQLLNNQEEFTKLTTNAYQWASTHNADWTAAQHRLLYERLIKK